jgi:hypothetical protein
MDLSHKIPEITRELHHLVSCARLMSFSRQSTYLATGNFEQQGWKAACKRGDIEPEAGF